MGVYFGGEHVGTGRSDENVKGFWERRDVRDLNDHILFNSRCDWDCVTNFRLDEVSRDTHSGFVSAAGDIVLNMDAHRPWFIKEPRLCVLFPIWRESLENPFCIHVLRNPLEIAHSLEARNNIPINAGLALWEIYSLHALSASAGLRRIFVSYEDLMRDASTVVDRISSALSQQGGYELRIPSRDELNHFIDDRLYRHRKTERSLRSVATAPQLSLYETLKGDKEALEEFSPPELSQSSIETLMDYERSVDVDRRIEVARAARRQRVPEGSAVPLKLRDLELEHARSLMKQTSQRLSATEREARRLRQAEIEVRTSLAGSVQRADDLAFRLELESMTTSRLEDERSALGDLNAQLGKARALLQQANRNLEQTVSRLKHERSDLEKANAELQDALTTADETAVALREDLGAVREKLAARTRDSEILAEDNAALEKDIANRTRESGALAASNAALEEGLASRIRESEALAASNAALERELAVRTRESGALTASNAALAKDLAVRTQESGALTASNDALKEDLAARTREAEALADDNAALHKDVAAREQANMALNEEADNLRLERSLLKEANAQLEERRAALEQSHARAVDNAQELEDAKSSADNKLLQLEKDHAHEAGQLRRLFDEVSGRRSRVRATVVLWDRELDHRRHAASELVEIISGLGSDVASLLDSRRWRLGRAIVSGLYFLSFRGIPRDIGNQLSIANAEYEAKAILIGGFATSRDDIPRRLVELVPTTAPSIDELLDSEPHRHAEMTVQLLERALELRRRARQIEGMSVHVDALASIFEGMVRSWRWRVGSFLVASLYRVTRGKAPATAADSAAALVKRYRSGTYADMAKRPVIPLPPDDDQTVIGAGGSSAGMPPDAAPTGDGTKFVTAKAPSRLLPPTRRSVRPRLPVASVDIVVCVHDALPDVQRCLASVLSRTAIDYRLVVVNDGSNPETTAWLRRLSERHAAIQLIETEGPLGYTRAANRGLRASGAANVVLLNSDTIVPRLWVESMLECLRIEDRVGIVGPLSNAASWQSIPERFDDGGGWAVNDLPTGYNVDEYSELVHQISDRAFPRVAFLNGFCLLIRREVIEAIGYLDEDAFPRGYGEENDYCIRARKAGFRLAIADHCFVYHAKSRSFGNKTRDRLAEDGRTQLTRKHGSEVIERGTRNLKENPDLARIRSTVKSHLARGHPERVADAGHDPTNGSKHDMRVLFVLPVRGGSGGANSVVQEVAGMRTLGVDARVAVEARHAQSMHRFYADVLDADSRIVFESGEDLVSIGARFDVIVATLWSTPALIAPIAERWPEKAYIYYVQDYEPWFFPYDQDSRTLAFDSYTRVPNMALMAKTDWICRTVRERHGVEVFRVTPSLDHSVFFPAVRAAADAVTLAAMIRPSTPRRAPIRTLRVLRDLALRFEGLRILLFGCETHTLEALARRTEPSLTLDFAFENRGILKRREVADLLRESDIFLDLSDYQAFGRSGLEAMACGCATVLPARGGVDEYAVDGENAFLVDTSSFTEMTSTVARIVSDQSLREDIRQRSLETAARYSVNRASLSELSIFRWVWTVPGNNKFRGDAYRRGIDPPAQAQRTTIAVYTGFDGLDGVADDATQQRVLRPLRYSALKNAVSVVEVQSPAAICRSVPDVCVVHNALQATIAQAEEVVAACRETGAILVYSCDRQAERAFRGRTSTAATVLAQSASRVVASTESVGESLVDSGRPVRILPAALDETIWLTRSVLGEGARTDRDRNGRLQVLFIGTESELNTLLPALQEVNKDGRRVEVAAFGDFSSELPACVERMCRREQSYDDFVAGLRARNHWDAAVLPVNEASVDADVRFLAFAALRLAIVCSRRGDHTRFARHTENSLMVPNTQRGWRNGLSQLVVDSELIERLRDQALYDAENKHSLRRCWTNFRQAYVHSDVV